MDFLIDERFFKSLKPFGLGVLAIATALGTLSTITTALGYVYNKYS